MLSKEHKIKQMQSLVHETDRVVERKCHIRTCIGQPGLSYAAATSKFHILVTYYSKGSLLFTLGLPQP